VRLKKNNKPKEERNLGHRRLGRKLHKHKLDPSLVTAFWGCLGDQGSGTNNYKGPRRGKGIETWPSAFSKYCFKKKTKFLVRHLGRLPEEQKQGLLVATNGSLVAHGYTKKVLGTADD